MKSQLTIAAAVKTSVVPALATFLLIVPGLGEPGSHFVRNYPALVPIHLSVTDGHGDITISAWNKREISVRTSMARPVMIEDRVNGSTISLTVKHPNTERVDFDISAPADTCLAVKTTMGKI
ncbi:MAG TPA: hypothetical protein VJX67_16570, partial [Blastocatellia bacterium]|nr:hypothetical protein [Blastocatellia bacterium]